MKDNVWLTRWSPKPGARLRLFCIPYAGAGASAFRTWSASLPESVEVCGIQLPGRESRLREPPFARLTPLVSALADALVDEFGQPFALYGHSMGARVAFELARELRRRGQPGPTGLLVSGRRAPHCVETESLHSLTTSQLISHLRRLNGTPEAILQEPELLSLFLPTLRADLAVNETAEYRVEELLACPIAAFGGRDDEVCTSAQLQGWQDHTRSWFTSELFEGGHFFIHTASDEVLAGVSRVLDRLVPP